MAPFDRVVLIFNPNSTGNAKDKAAELREQLSVRVPQLPVELSATQHAGHARDLARDAARVGQPLLVSVSGDGGYNEVVNGVMASGSEQAVCAVLAAGNANDHRRTTREQPLADTIVAGNVSRIDLLKLTVDGDDAVRPLLHRARADPGRGRRPGEGRQGLAAGDGGHGARVRPVPPIRDRAP